jgi:hypothetical protein
MVGTRSLSSGAHSRDPLALPTYDLEDLRRGISAVIASEAKQSIVPQAVKWIASSLRSSQ